VEVEQCLNPRSAASSGNAPVFAAEPPATLSEVTADPVFRTNMRSTTAAFDVATADGLSRDVK
jgi:hypothetical protein